MNTTKRYQLPISKLFEILNINNIEYETPVLNKHNIKINSPSGYVHINAFVKKYHDTATYYLDNGESLTCSTKHIVFQKGVPRVINNCSFIDTIDGESMITSVEYHHLDDVYDVSLDAPHQYVTPNRIVHHNTTLAKILFNELDVNPLDILEINASRTNSVEDVRDRITNFVKMIPFGDFRIVLLDEADYLSVNAQAALRGVMEEYHQISRFILTCNYPNKIIPAIHSRCQGFHIAKVDLTEFTARAAEILLLEQIQFDIDVLDTYVKATYPDLRKCINMLQMNSTDGVLARPSEGDNGSADWKLEMVELFKAGKIQAARKLLCGTIRAEEIEEVYRWLYDHIELFGNDAQQDNAVLIIKQGLVDHTLVVDPEINLAAVLIKLANI
jgi:DNA polymerase III delta prime subunit